MKTKTETAVFGGGCFWCTEAVFEQLKGVVSIVPGYAEGVEVIRIEFDPSQIAYRDFLTVFFAMHDPTTKNRQGADIGPQYRSIILYTTEEQKRLAEEYIKELRASFPVVTELEPLEKFSEAEEHHKRFYQKNPDQPYCQLVITPKILKVEKEFSNLLKRNEKR